MSERDTVYSASRRHLGFAVPTIDNTPCGGVAWITVDFILFIGNSAVMIFSTHFVHTSFTLHNVVGEFIPATRATFRPCMGLLSARCSSSGGSTWRVQSVCKLLATHTFTSLNIPLGNENEALDSSKHHGDRKIKLLQWTVTRHSTYIGMKVSIVPLKTVIAHIGWVAVSVWMSFASSPSMYVSSFSPTDHPVNSVMIL